MPDDTADLVAAVAAGGSIFIRSQPDCYEFTETIHISRSHTQLIAEPGTCLRLANNTNEPVILIGSASATVAPDEHISDIVVSGFNIDGNRSNQSQESSATYLNVQNNGIAIRGTKRAYLSNLVLCNSRSGGLVISQRSEEVWVSNTIFCNNHFDGLAIDGASKIFVTDFIAEGNDASGVSIDTGSANLVLSNGLIRDNNDNGLFARFTSDSAFRDLTISGSCNYGVFLSHAASINEGLTNVVFDGLNVMQNGSTARFPDPFSGPSGFNFSTSIDFDSADDFLMNSVFSGNTNGGVTVVGAGLTQHNNIDVPHSAGSGPVRDCP